MSELMSIVGGDPLMGAMIETKTIELHLPD
jgi:hypothetical protein